MEGSWFITPRLYQLLTSRSQERLSGWPLYPSPKIRVLRVFVVKWFPLNEVPNQWRGFERPGARPG
jgi:hypothetical protein